MTSVTRSAPSRHASVSYFRRVQDTMLWRQLHVDLLTRLPPGRGRRALDIGCGPGLLCRLLHDAGYEVVGVDRQPDMVAAARQASGGRTGMTFREGDATALPLPDAAFDVVVMANLLFLLPDPLVGVQEMARVCRPGGQVAVLNPAPTLTTASAERLAATGLVPDDERWALVNWARPAEVHGTIDGAMWQVLAELADLRAVDWAPVGVAGVGRVGRAVRAAAEVADAG